MKLVFFAYTNFGYQCVEFANKQCKHEILVVSAPYDKGEPINNWESVVSYSRNHDIPFILHPKNKITPEVIEKVISFLPDMVFSCNYPLIIPGSILKATKHGGLNFHGGNMGVKNNN